MNDFETLAREERQRLTRRVTRMLGGDRETAEDLSQEALLRAWRRMPQELDRPTQRAWVHRTASNLALDELRRRGRRRSVALDEFAGELAGNAATSSQAELDQPGLEGDSVREALERLSVHDRFVVLLRFDAGLTHAEIAQLLGVSEEAARKRAARARAAFVAAYRACRVDGQPLIVLCTRGEAPEPYVDWLERAGARVQRHAAQPSERTLALADGLVFTGAYDDIHSELYGEAPRALRGDPDLRQDREDLDVLLATLALDLPFVGVCRGHQLLNIACGGTLYQDIGRDGASRERHDLGVHRISTSTRSKLRSLIGAGADVPSEHHQAVRRLGRNLAPTADSSDGLIETIEHTGRRFTIGLQWHPELQPGEAGDRVADALVECATRAAA